MTASDSPRIHRIVLGLVAASVAILLWTRADYVAVWDGRIYAACITAAAERLTADSLRCGGHASQAYAALAAIAQMVVRDSPVPLLVVNAALLLAASVGFARLIQLVFPSGDAFDRTLLTAAFVLQPSFLAAVVQPGIDLPLLPAFIWSIVFALERRWRLMTLMGFVLAFTKETGVLLYALVLACYVLSVEARMPGSAGERVRRVIRMAPAALPGVAFVGYLLYRTMRPDQPLIWYTGTTNESLLRQFLVPRLDLYQVNYAALLLVLNFAWMMSLVLVADAFVGSVRAMHREPPRLVSAAHPQALAFMTVLSIVVGYALTRFTTFGHTRYFLTVTALLIVLFYASALRLGLRAPVRHSLLGLYVVLLGISAVRTIDPVSRRLYGTFAFGSHSLLRMTRVTGECCGTGQDQLVYNLQFTAFHDVVDVALASIAADDSSLIVVPDSTGWILVGALDRSSHRRTLATQGVVRPRVREPRHLVQDRFRPAVGHYFALPNGNDVRARELLGRVYEIGPEVRLDRSGYSLSVYTLSSRSQ